MKLKQWRNGILAAAASAATGAGLVSCGTSNTVDYLYATSSKNNPGQINVYRVDSQSGALTQIPDSPYNAGRDPVSLVIDYPGKNLFVANNLDNSIIQFAIGTDAKLYGQHTVNTPGSAPVAIAIRSYYGPKGKLLGHLLFLIETFQPNFGPSNQGPGGALVVYNLPADANDGVTLGSPVTQTVNGVASSFVPLGVSPTAVNVSGDGLHVYVTDLLGASQTGTGLGGCTAGQGGIQGYNLFDVDSQGMPTGVLTTVAGSPFCAGTTPSAIADYPVGVPSALPVVSPSIKPTATTLPRETPYLYATDSSQNQVITYGIDVSRDPQTFVPSATFGALSARVSGPVSTGTAPDGITVDPRGNYVYVANRTGQSLSGYAIDKRTGVLTSLATNGSAGTQGQPGCVIVEPALGRFVYTADFLGGDVSGFIMDPNTGGLSATLGVYYGTAGLSHCVAATPHGNHPVLNPAD